MLPGILGRQPSYTPRYLGSPWIRNMDMVGQISPAVEARMNKIQGRNLSGFGSTAEDIGTGPSTTSQSLEEMESLDDTYGSGIFDNLGRQATSNAGTGVFESSYSLPGYVGREIPFTVSPEVRDLTDDADVVVVPGGGMAYVERHGRLAGPHRLREGRPPPPSVQQTPLTTNPTPRDRVYVEMSYGREIPIHGAAPRLRGVMPTATPGIALVPGSPGERRVLPTGERRVPQRDDVIPVDPRSRIARAEPLSGFGEVSPTIKYGFIGLALGAAAGVAVHYWRKNKGR